MAIVKKYTFRLNIYLNLLKITYGSVEPSGVWMWSIHLNNPERVATKEVVTANIWYPCLKKKLHIRLFLKRWSIKITPYNFNEIYLFLKTKIMAEFQVNFEKL